MDVPYKMMFHRETSQTFSKVTLPWEVQIEIIRGQAKNLVRPVRTPAFLIGSAEDCDLVLGDPRFSDVHVCLMIQEDGVWLRHIGFLPEVTVNGTKTAKMILADGDVLRTGPYEFRIAIYKRFERPKPKSNGEDSVRFDRPHLRIHPASMDAEIKAQVAQLVADIRAELGVPKKEQADSKEPLIAPTPKRLEHALQPPSWMASISTHAQGA